MPLLSLLLLLILSPSSAWAEWSEIGSVIGPKGFIIYIDQATLPTEHQVVVTATHLREYKSPQADPASGKPVHSVAIQAEYDCHMERERVLATTHYGGPKATGPVIASEPGNNQWQDIAAGSISATVWKAACR